MIGISEELTVIRPGGALSPRCAGVLEAALAGRQAEVLSRLEGPLTGRRLLFVVSLDEGGVNRGFYDLLAHLRTHPNCLDRCVGSVLVDAPGDLYTKAAGRDLVLAANLAGCAFVGRPLVEGTGDLRNFTVQARNAGCSLEAAYHLATADLVERVLAFSRPRLERPKLLALHASSRATSNTLALWGLVRTRLEERCDITEICLRNGTLEDCAGCPYTTCLHFGEQGGCFYGGVMVQEVYPAIREAEHEGIGRAWVVERKWEPSLYKTHLFYLMENERAVMLGDTHLSPLGWETMFGATVDCTGEEPIYAGYHQISHDDKVLGCYFGQINDPAIETVVISIQQEEYDQGKAVRSELRRLTVEQEDFVTGRDRTFFWIMEPLPLEQSPEAVCYPVMIAYDAEGRIAAEFDIECCTYSGYG